MTAWDLVSVTISITLLTLDNCLNCGYVSLGQLIDLKLKLCTELLANLVFLMNV